MKGQQSGLLSFVHTGYFCVPPNPDLVALRDIIDDRLYKVRKFQDINGKGVQLRLFKPALDPGALIQAQVSGASLESFLSELDQPLPNFRFINLLQKAFELCGELKGMGEQFLSIKEKKDSEALAAFRMTQELTIGKMFLEMKKLQKEEGSNSFEALQDTRRGHESKLSFYLRLGGERHRPCCWTRLAGSPI